ncbi:hypothetical protein G6F37_012388 [Rhizopus arrhizus]|nr:hypothetical protein G6F38_012409 [Rhizopus arrhizus]KAG1143958.1 hypothetical protein G6F37_012388 [Rhizopus arrhizus]
MTLVHFKALIDPVNKTLLIQQTISNSQSVAKPIHTLNSTSINNLSADVEIPQEIADFLLLYKNLVSQSPTQTITNAPIQHRIDTGSSPPSYDMVADYHPRSALLLKMKCKLC